MGVSCLHCYSAYILRGDSKGERKGSGNAGRTGKISILLYADGIVIYVEIKKGMSLINYVLLKCLRKTLNSW